MLGAETVKARPHVKMALLIDRISDERQPVHVQGVAVGPAGFAGPTKSP